MPSLSCSSGLGLRSMALWPRAWPSGPWSVRDPPRLQLHCPGCSLPAPQLLPQLTTADHSCSHS